jgi:hypothetical protein
MKINKYKKEKNRFLKNHFGDRFFMQVIPALHIKSTQEGVAQHPLVYFDRSETHHAPHMLITAKRYPAK